MNKIKSVYHGEHGLRTMKELARSYLTISADPVSYTHLTLPTN